MDVSHALRACALILIASLLSYSQNPGAEPNAVRAGFLLYSHRCAACHGKNAEGGRGPDLTRAALSGGQQDSDLFRIISNGVPGTEMRAYAERFQPDEIRQVIEYLKSTARESTARSGDTSSAGDRGRGEALFWGKGACGNCHSVGSQGNRIGPDLTSVGRRRGPSYLKTALLQPDQEITGGYESVTVVTNEGKTLRGIQRAVDDFSVQFMDMQGNYYSFDRSQLRSVKTDAGSLMPGYGNVFGPVELDDMLAYLLSLRGKEVRP